MLTVFGRLALGLGAVAAAAIAGQTRSLKHDRQPGTRSLDALRRAAQGSRRKPPEAGIASPAVPPRGPLPKHGGAAAELQSDR